MGGLGLMFRRRAIQAHPTAGSDYIKFADEEVLRVLMNKGVSSDGVGITKADAASVTSIMGWFSKNATIKTFDELRFFTGLKKLEKTSNNVGAFQNCTALESIVLPDDLEEIGENCFSGCTSLTGIIDIRDKNIKVLGSNCYNGCTGITDIYLGESTEKLDAPYRYAKFKYSPDGIIRLPNLKGTLGYYVFQGSDIVRVEDLGNVEIIGATKQGYYCYTFYQCYNLEFLRFPASVTNIGSRACQRNSKMTTVVLESVVPPTLAEGDIFYPNKCNFYVPDESVEAYKAANIWSVYAARIFPMSQLAE